MAFSERNLVCSISHSKSGLFALTRPETPGCLVVFKIVINVFFINKTITLFKFKGNNKMNFRRYLALDQEASEFIEEASKVLNGEEVAKELGITRTAVKQITTRAISKLYNSISGVDSSLSPFQIFMTLCQLLDVLTDDKGIKDVMRNLSGDQKVKVATDIKSKYPNLDVFKFGVK